MQRQHGKVQLPIAVRSPSHLCRDGARPGSKHVAAQSESLVFKFLGKLLARSFPFIP